MGCNTSSRYYTFVGTLTVNKEYVIPKNSTATYDLDGMGESHTVVEKSTGEEYTADIYSTQTADERPKYEDIYKVFKRTDHPNLMKLRGVYKKKKKGFTVMFVRTHCDGGELFDRILDDPKGYIDEDTAVKYVFEMLQALNHLHENNIAHRNIKPESFHFTSKNHREAKLMLMTTLMVTTPGFCEDLTKPCGTPQYCAPEILNRAPYGKQVDMWSLGVTVYSMLCRYPPFQEEDYDALYDLIKKGKFSFDNSPWDKVSPEAKEFVSNLLVVEPGDRMTCGEALRHFWIVNNNCELIVS